MTIYLEKHDKPVLTCVLANMLFLESAPAEISRDVGAGDLLRDVRS